MDILLTLNDLSRILLIMSFLDSMTSESVTLKLFKGSKDSALSVLELEIERIPKQIRTNHSAPVNPG